MWLKVLALGLFLTYASCQNYSAQPKVVCYYNSTSFLREGNLNLALFKKKMKHKIYKKFIELKKKNKV